MVVLSATDTQDGDELKTQQQMLAELRYLRKENAGLKDEIAANKSTIATQTRIIEIERERGDFFKAAAEKGIKIGDNSGLMTEKYDRMVATYDAEVRRLQTENDKLRESRKWRSVMAGLGGAGAGFYIGQQQCR